MKKHQLAAMLLSALSAGLLISCTKPNDTNDETTNTDSKVEEAVDNKATKDQANTLDRSVTPTESIKLSEETLKDYLQSVANDQIFPSYKSVAEQSARLNTLATKHCHTGSVNSETLTVLRQQWLELAKAWASAEIVNFGPAMDSMSNLYINYYPDERGLVHQGVIDLIDANPKLTPEQLAQESAVVQGIPGIEEVLFANDTLDAGQCQYVISASSALAQRLSEVDKAWEAVPVQLLAGEEGDVVLGMNRWINSLLSLVETTKSSSLDKPLGLTGSKKGHLPAATAGQSRDIITAKVAALNTALTDPKLVAMLAENDKDTLTDEISTILAQTSTLLAQLPEDIADATPEQQQSLYDKLTALTHAIKRQLMPTLGIQVGFNSTDGD